MIFLFRLVFVVQCCWLEIHNLEPPSTLCLSIIVCSTNFFFKNEMLIFRRVSYGQNFQPKRFQIARNHFCGTNQLNDIRNMNLECHPFRWRNFCAVFFFGKKTSNLTKVKTRQIISCVKIVSIRGKKKCSQFIDHNGRSTWLNSTDYTILINKKRKNNSNKQHAQAQAPITRRKHINTHNPKLNSLSHSFIIWDGNQLFCRFDRDGLFAFYRFG